MATPAVAGAAALVTQYFKDPAFWAANCYSTLPLCSSFQPSGSLVKTVLMHSGQNIGGGLDYPGNSQGFGRIQLNKVLRLTSLASASSLSLYVNDITLASQATTTVSLSVASSSLPLKVTICWMDPKNTVGAAKQLLNNIDLTVTGPSGDVSYGNNIVTGDTLNNAEMVLISVPEVGFYSVTLTAKVFPDGKSQLVSMVATAQLVAPNTPTGVPTTPRPSISHRPTLTPTRSKRPTLFPTSVPPTSAPSSANSPLAAQSFLEKHGLLVLIIVGAALVISGVCACFYSACGRKNSSAGNERPQSTRFAPVVAAPATSPPQLNFDQIYQNDRRQATAPAPAHPRPNQSGRSQKTQQPTYAQQMVHVQPQVRQTYTGPLVR